MLADKLDRLVERLSKELIRTLREASRAELLALMPALGRLETAAARKPPKATKAAKAAPRATRAPKSSGPASSKRGAGSLTRQILGLLKVRREGWRSEEIQRRLKADPEELRDVLSKLVAAGRAERHGQARGTRYSLPSIDGPESNTPSSVRVFADDSSLESPDSPPAPPIEVTDQMIDRVRLELSNSASPLPLQELQTNLPYKREDLKTILDHMVKEGFIERIRSGPITRIKMSAHAPKKAPAEAATRVHKRSHGDAPKGDSSVESAKEAESGEDAEPSEPDQGE